MTTINNPSLVLANLVAAYLSLKATRSPNPTPPNLDESDTLSTMLHIWRSVEVGSIHMLSLNLAQAYLIARGVTPSSSSSLKFFPNLGNVNEKYLTWNRFSATCLGLIGVSGVLRLAAYRSLGKDFTFELARPSGLKTDGIYRYVQHPSYLPLFVIIATNTAYVMAPDAVTGAWLGKELVERLKSWVGWGFVGWMGIFGAILAVRVRDEEAMLRKEFGKEWEEWHKRTARFVPWIF